jgi:phosphatidylserine decarboxylase
MSNSYPHPIIAREGWPYLTASLIVAIVVTWLWGWWSVPFWVIYFFILQFFRDPPREIPQGEGLVLCPADGRVIVVGEAMDPYRNVKAVKVSVFMNVFNVHSNRSPVDAVVKEIAYSRASSSTRPSTRPRDNERTRWCCAWMTARSCRACRSRDSSRAASSATKVGERLARGSTTASSASARASTWRRPGRRRAAIEDIVKATSTVLAELPRA